MSGDGQVAAVATGTELVVILDRNGDSKPVLKIRRLDKRDHTNIGLCVPEATMGSSMLLAELMCRKAIVDAENLTDADSGERVPFKTTHHPKLGVIASDAVWFALSGDDMSRVIAKATAKLSEAQTGN